MSKQGWLKREIETVQREVATWPAWKRWNSMNICVSAIEVDADTENQVVGYT